jgi:hypothetical protein
MVTDDFSAAIDSSGTENSSFGWEKSQKNPRKKSQLEKKPRRLARGIVAIK